MNVTLKGLHYYHRELASAVNNLLSAKHHLTTHNWKIEDDNTVSTFCSRCKGRWQTDLPNNFLLATSDERLHTDCTGEEPTSKGEE
jgi:hypothetical protein